MAAPVLPVGVRRVRFALPGLAAPGGADTGAPRQMLGALTLLGIMYSSSVGGAFGVEDAVGDGGALLCILFVLLLPIIQFPVAIVVSELSTAIPTNAGFLMWFNVAFPPVVYFFSVLMALMYTFIDNALYPSMFAHYVCRSVECTKTHETLLKIAILLVSTFLNVIGVEIVGVGCFVITLVSIAPFVLLFFWQVFAGDGLNWERLGTFRTDVDWATFVPGISWNFSGLEQAGAVAEEIANPQKAMIRAMIPLCLLVYVTYIPPIMAGVSAQKRTDWSEWRTGYWANAAKNVGGIPLKLFMVVSGVVASFGLTLSAICCTSRLIAGIAAANAFPGPVNRVLGHYVKRFGTPVAAILVNAVITGVVSTSFSFATLVGIDQVLYGIRVVMVMLAFLKLRFRYPGLARPFRVPLSSTATIFAVFPTIIFSVGLTVVSVLVNWPTFIMCTSVLLGMLVVSVVYVKIFRPDGFAGALVDDDSDTTDIESAVVDSNYGHEATEATTLTIASGSRSRKAIQ